MTTGFIATAGRLAAGGTGTPVRTRTSALQSAMRRAARTTDVVWRRASTALLVVAAFALSWSESALAQTSGSTNTTTITLDVANIKREIPGQTGYYDYRDTKRWWISYQDCINEENFTFPLNLSNTTSPLEVWVGTDDCAARRGVEDHGQCWLVQNVPSPDDPQTVSVPVRNVVNNDTDRDSVPENLGRDVCTRSDDLNGEAVTFWFMVVDGGKSIGSVSWNPTNVGGTGYDMVGPAPPGNISVGIGESQLTIRLEELKEDTTRDSFEAFCVPEGTLAEFVPDTGAAGSASAGSAGSANAGTAGSANAGSAGSANAGSAGSSGTAGAGGSGGTPSPAACRTDVARGGIRPPRGYECGTAPTTSPILNTTRLENGIHYAVGVAARDDIGNTGDLSDIECGTPILMDDFFEVYSRNGGPGGGGGFCSVAPGHARFSSVAAWVGGLALLALAVRRQRSAA